MTRNQIRSIFPWRIRTRRRADRDLARCTAQDFKEPYPTMAPIEQYLMDRVPEIALAPQRGSRRHSYDASVVVLTRHGYETAVEGKNGWVCWVGRGWMGMFDNPEFWNQKFAPQIALTRQPPARSSRTPTSAPGKLLAGHSKQEAVAAIQSRHRQKKNYHPSSRGLSPT